MIAAIGGRWAVFSVNFTKIFLTDAFCVRSLNISAGVFRIEGSADGPSSSLLEMAKSVFSDAFADEF
jgi:hypothetical protein